jgi:regulator of replication initiation timing
MPPKTRKPPSAAEQAKDDRPVVARVTELPPYPFPLGSDTHAPSDNSRALRPSKRPWTAMAPIVNGNRSGLIAETRAQNALGQIEESLSVLKEELQTRKQECGKLKSDLSHARDQNIALEEELRNLRDRERLQRLDSTAKIDDLILQLTKQKAKAASEHSTAYQMVNDRK